MNDVFVVFGSESDSHVYGPLLKALKQNKIKHKFEVCSAHREPERLDKLIKKRAYSLVIAGAGLSAALPGVIASKIKKTVIGIPISANYEGLDALLSIVQMPCGVPVLSVGVGNIEEAVRNAGLIINKSYTSVNIISDENLDKSRLSKAIEILNENNVEHKISNECDSDCVNISTSKTKQTHDCFVINVPKMQRSSAKNSLELMRRMRSGLWVGLNRIDNAALAAVQMIKKDM